MTSPYLILPDDFEVGQYITVANPEDCPLHGTVLQIKAVDLPLIVVRMWANWAGDILQDHVFPINIKNVQFKRISDAYVNAMLRKDIQSTPVAQPINSPQMIRVVQPNDILALLSKRAEQRAEQPQVAPDQTVDSDKQKNWWQKLWKN